MKCTEFCEHCKEKNCNNLQEHSVLHVSDVYEENDDETDINIMNSEVDENFAFNISNDDDDDDDEMTNSFTINLPQKSTKFNIKNKL